MQLRQHAARAARRGVIVLDVTLPRGCADLFGPRLSGEAHVTAEPEPAGGGGHVP